MMLTEDILKKCMPYATKTNIKKYVAPLAYAMNMFDINTPARQAAFLAQLAHESGSLRYSQEIASGEAYEGRKDLGNINPGDGKKYKGRGPIQITGRSNYKKVGDFLGLNLIDHPELLETPENGCKASAWFWAEHAKLNSLADLNTLTSFKQITKRINGGYNGLEDRLKHWEHCKKAFNI